MEVPHRETYPEFEGLLVDEALRIWIGAYPRPGEMERRWVIVVPAGHLQGTLLLPVDAQPLDSTGDLLAALRRNELDEAHIVIYRVSPS